METDARPATVTTPGARQSYMDNRNEIWTNVAECLEQLRMHSLTDKQKDILLSKILDLVSINGDARSAMSCHPQSIPVLVGLLRSSVASIKTIASRIIEILSKDAETRTKVLLGGAIPPLLALLKTGSLETQMDAACAIYALSKGTDEDKVGPKIFATENAVPYLWERLQKSHKATKLLDGILLGSLRNLCQDTDGFWEETEQAGGLDIILRLVSSGCLEAQRHACYLLAKMIVNNGSACGKVMQAGCTDWLLRFLSPGNDFALRAEAAGALKALSYQSRESRRLIVNLNGISVLINAAIAPSKEAMGGEVAQALQENAMGALANVAGGLYSVIRSMAESIETNKSDLDVADTLGALASALLIYEGKDESATWMDPQALEHILIRKIQSSPSRMIHDSVLEALASLYGNKHLGNVLMNSEVKKILVSLITVTTSAVQGEFLKSFLRLCNTQIDLWGALECRQGVQLLVSLLGVSTEEQQECAVSLLAILSQEHKESNWAITAAGGIPPLVQILESGSVKAREDAAIILGSLCTHSEDIRSCVEKAGAMPALLWLLKNASPKGQEIAARTLKDLVTKAHATTISLLNAMLTGDVPESKLHVLDALIHFLSISPLADMLYEGSPANVSFCALVGMLNSLKEESQQHAASMLSKLLKLRKDLRESPMVADIVTPLQKILIARDELLAMHAAECLASLFISIKNNPDITETSRKTMTPLLKLCRSANMDVLQRALAALAELFQDQEVTIKAPFEGILQPLTRVLQEGTLEAKASATRAFSRLIRTQSLNDILAEKIHHLGTLQSLLSLLTAAHVEDDATLEALEILAIVTKSNRANQPLWDVFAESIGQLVKCLAAGQPLVQNKAIEILSQFCNDQPIMLGDMIATTAGCVTALAEKVITGPGTQLQIEATALLVCAAKEHPQHTMNSLQAGGHLLELIQSLVQSFRNPVDDDFLTADCSPSIGLNSDESDSDALREHRHEDLEKKTTRSSQKSHLTHTGKAIAVWMLSILAAYDNKMKCLIADAGAIEAISHELEQQSPFATHDTLEDKSGTWASAFLLAILLQEKKNLALPEVNRTIPILANLLKSGNSMNKYFAGQSIVSIIFNGDRSTILAIANSGAPSRLINLLGTSDMEDPYFINLTKEFALVQNPAQTALEHLFRINDIKMGSTARKVIPTLVELLTPTAERPHAPLYVQGLLTLLATDSHANKLAMAEAGILEALTRYLSLGPQDNMEECTADLLRILFGTVELRCHESAIGALNQLVALLRLGGKGARFNAGRALQELFMADHITNHDTARQSIPPFMEMMRTGSEKEQRVALRALSRLAHDNPPKAAIIADPEYQCLDILRKILLANCSMELKEEAAGLCFALFSCSRVRAYPMATHCIEPLVLLLADETARPTWLAGLYALNNLLENDSLAELAAAQGAVQYMVAMLSDLDQSFYDIALSGLLKLGKVKSECKLQMVRLGIIDRVLYLMPSLSDFGCTSAAELLCILTDTTSIAKQVDAASLMETLLSTLSRPSLGSDGQVSTMQVLINILGSSQLSDYRINPNQPLKPLISLLDSPSQKVQNLASELFSHLLVERRLEHDVISKKVVNSLVQLSATGTEAMQHKAIFALETASSVLPQDVAEAGGILEASKVILQMDPLPPHELWESACCVICNILQISTIYYWQVPVETFVRMLQSDNESTLVIALQGMLALEKENPAYAELYVKSGTIDALLELLRCHQCEEAVAEVLESLLNDTKVRNMKIAHNAIAPLAHYLLDQGTKNRPARLLSALALGDLFQQGGGVSASTSDVMLACQALMKILEEHPAEDIRIVTLSALQNIVQNGRVNKHALVESGAMDLVCNLLCSNSKETATQAATLTKILVSKQIISDDASTNMIRSLSVALQNDSNQGTENYGDIIHATAALFKTLPKLRATDTATLCIPQLVRALKIRSEGIQDAALETLYLLQQGWKASTADVAKAQALAIADAIPALQGFIKSGRPKFHERASTLLLCLPGSLVVTLKQGKNLKQKLGSTNAFCKLSIGNSSTKETKVVPHSTSPEWNQEFAWPFDSPPKGQKVQIVCKNKATFSKGTLGKVMIQVDRVITLGTISGNYTLQPSKNPDGTPRVLEIEITWSRR